MVFEYEDTRQITVNGASYSVNLPKTWCRGKSLDKGSKVKLIVTDKVIVIATTEEDAKETLEKLKGSD